MGTVERTIGSGRRRSSRRRRKSMLLRPHRKSKDKPGTHRSTWQIARETGVSQSSVVRIVHKDLLLKCFKRRRAQELTASNQLARRLVRSWKLLKRYTEHEVALMWFTDEKIFTAAAPSNSQKYRVYSACDMLKKQLAAKWLLRTWNTFSQSIMVSVGVSEVNWAVRSCFSSIQARK